MTEEKNRAKERNSAIWTKLINLNYMGIDNYLEHWEENVNKTGLPGIETFLIVIDDVFDRKQEQLQKTIEYKYTAIDTDKTNIDAIAENRRKILALQKQTNDYILQTLQYGLEVQRLMMDAKFVAARLVGEAEKSYQQTRYEVERDRTDIRLEELDIEIGTEKIRKKLVELDVLKALLDVERTKTNAVLADIRVVEAENRKIQAEVEKAMVEVTRARLAADIASTFAEIVTRELTATKYDVRKREIDKAFDRITNRLNAELELLQQRILQQKERENENNNLLEEVTALQEIKESIENQRILEQQKEREVFEHEKDQQISAIEQEETIRDSEVEKQKELLEQLSLADIEVMKRKIDDEILLNEARKWAAKHQIRGIVSHSEELEQRIVQQASV